jgi:hypothetical protein
MSNPHLALIFIRRFSDFFREPLDQLSIFFRGQRGQFGFRKGCAREPLYDWMAQAGSHAPRPFEPPCAAIRSGPRCPPCATWYRLRLDQAYRG